MVRTMTTVSDRVLSPTELRALSGRSNTAGAARLAVHAGLLIGTGWLVAISAPWTLLPTMVAFGLVQVALFAPAHEATHQTAFASRRTNLIVGWLAAAPSLLNLHFYTAFHFAHHRHTQIPGQDPELDMVAPNNLASYVRRILGVPYWRLRLLVVADAWRGDLSRYPYVSQRRPRRSSCSVRAMSAAMVGGATVAGCCSAGRRRSSSGCCRSSLPAVPARLRAGRAHGLHAGPQRTDQHPYHADQRGGTAADVEHAVPRRASSLPVDPVPSAGGCARDAAGQAGLRGARRIRAMERRRGPPMHAR